jgi:hypothetical protein
MSEGNTSDAPSVEETFRSFMEDPERFIDLQVSEVKEWSGRGPLDLRLQILGKLFELTELEATKVRNGESSIQSSLIFHCCYEARAMLHNALRMKEGVYIQLYPIESDVWAAWARELPDWGPHVHEGGADSCVVLTLGGNVKSPRAMNAQSNKASRRARNASKGIGRFNFGKR